ncbi:MAG TPA: energy transducer TonB [Mucilaginibacter sp.]|jgi:TonB family protein
MKRSLFLIATCFIYTLASGQKAKDVVIIRKSHQEAKEPFIKDDEKYPSYPGGMAMFYKYISQHIIYPKKAQASKIEGKVIIQFIVEKDGKVSNIKVTKSPSIDLSDESVRVLKDMRSVPGTVSGKPARMALQLPFAFQLNNPKRHL